MRAILPLAGLWLGIWLPAAAFADLDLSLLERMAAARAPAPAARPGPAEDAGSRLAEAAGEEPGEALRLHRLAAEDGDAGAALALGLRYLQGRGVPRDVPAGVHFIRRAARAGHGEAQYTLGLMYYHGDGVRLDYAATLRWHRAASSNGHARAMNHLGMMHGLGEGGLEPDDVAAYAWFSLAAERGDENALTNRDLTERELSPEKRLMARRRALRIAAELGL